MSSPSRSLEVEALLGGSLSEELTESDIRRTPLTSLSQCARRAVVICVVVFGGCGTDTFAPEAPETSEAVGPLRTTVSEPCATAFEVAANISPYQDTHDDLFPAYSACSSIEEWKAADARYPAAIDGADPVSYAMTVCANNQDELSGAPICVAVNQAPDEQPDDLAKSSQSGLLGVPLPDGASLTESTAGEGNADPTEEYSVAASAAQIERFFERELPAAGWARDGTSDDLALFYAKGDLLVGVFIGKDGGSFTLMGS